MKKSISQYQFIKLINFSLSYYALGRYIKDSCKIFYSTRKININSICFRIVFQKDETQASKRFQQLI